MRTFCLLFLLLLLVFGAVGCASQKEQAGQQTPVPQERPAFWEEIQRFKEQDRQQMPPTQAILFVGSSSIRMWDNLAASFPAHTVLNRGFGGSTLLDLQRYLPDIVLPYQPKKVVIYSGENDLAGGTVGAEEVERRFITVFRSIRQEMPQVPIVFISIKPSPSRLQYLPQMKEANARIKQYLQNQPNAAYVDVFSPMLNEEGTPRPEIFLEDKLHMNGKGYQIWTETLRPYLK